MTIVVNRWQIRRTILLAVLVAAIAAACVLAFGSNARGGSAQASPPKYAALETSLGPGITLLDRPLPVGQLPTGPSFVTSQPAGAPLTGPPYPVAASIRPLSVGVPGVAAWIANSSGDGVCVLASAVGAPYYPLDIACSASGENGGSVTVEVRGVARFGGKNLLVGVVPDGTGSLEYKTTDGAGAHVEVQNNAWAALTTGTYSSQTAVGG
jgi:hypothetical protein